MDNTYNGWKNRQTWNVSLWINNDEHLYRSAVDYVKTAEKDKATYKGFVQSIGLEHSKTPDSIAYISKDLDYTALDEMIQELVN